MLPVDIVFQGQQCVCANDNVCVHGVLDTQFHGSAHNLQEP